MPPIKSGHIRYDSVTDGNDMYVVYSNPKAYPMYYIYFRWNPQERILILIRD